MAGALAFSAFQLTIAAVSPLSSQITRSLHVAFLLLLAYLLYPVARRGAHNTIPWYDWLLGLGAFALGFYHWAFEADLIQRAGQPSTADLVVGTAVVVLLFEAARRVIGIALPIVAGVFLAYGLFGQFLPGALAHRPFGYDQVVGQLYVATGGIYGTPTLVSATYIFLFILFGSFLEHSGMMRLFNSVALGTVGHTTGGPAKVSVISSGFMGMISGSGVANVLTVGSFTIPLMRRFGYSAVFAGAVETTASMGGQIMPPVMGAVAFIMAETLNVPYIEICKAAIVPAMLYYATAFWMVHLEAGRAQLMGMPKEECPDAWDAIRRQWYLLVPVAGLVLMLFNGFTPMFAGLTGLALTALLILGASVSASIGPQAFRVFFWIALGLGASSFIRWGIVPVIAVIAVLVALNALVQGGRATLLTMRAGLIDGATQALPVGLACAIVGVVIGVLTLTGAASTLAGFILQVGNTSLFLSLVLTMVVCLVLGMGIPTIPNYIITSAVAAPALLQLGVPLVVSHMFVFYFGIMADLTPPVALAALAASSIARAPYMRIGFKATQIAMAGFVVPYMAVYDPSLMLLGPWLDSAYVIGKALLAICLWGAAVIGYMWAPVGRVERVLSVVAAGLLVVALPVTDAIGASIAVALVLHQSRKARRDVGMSAPLRPTL
ncbi:MAG: TRAP transporter permease [Acidobacteria bacterium]|nr:TRAP transporter permease [Acidobacteriota bacterium]